MLQDAAAAVAAASHVRDPDRPYYGLTSLGLASLRETRRQTHRAARELPAIAGVAATDEERLALVRLWLGFSGDTTGHLVPRHAGRRVVERQGGVKPHSGKFATSPSGCPTPRAKKFTDALAARSCPSSASRRTASTGCWRARGAGDRWRVGLLRALPLHPAAVPRRRPSASTAAPTGAHARSQHRRGLPGPQGLLPGERRSGPWRTTPMPMSIIAARAHRAAERGAVRRSLLPR